MTAAEILQQIEGMEPALQRAYLNSVRASVDAAEVAEVERLIEAEDEAGLLTMLALGALAVFAESVRSVYLAGGRYELAAIVIPRPLQQEIGRAEFDMTRPAAGAWISQQLQQTRRVSTDDVRDAIRAVLAERRVVGGRQRTARQAALDLIGRRSPQTGQRTGGVLGLPGSMAQFVMNARSQLLSGEADQLKAYLQRGRRDRRFDSIIRRAMASGTAVAPKDVDRIAGRYAERLLATHLEMLARTAAAESFHAGREQAWEQLVEQGLDRALVEKEWRDRADEKVRDSHRHMRGQRVLLGQPFRTAGGALLRYPGDRSLGAGYEEVANCRCFCIYHLRTPTHG